MTENTAEKPQSLQGAVFQVIDEWFTKNPNTEKFEMNVADIERLLNKKGWSLDNASDEELEELGFQKV